MLDDRTRLDDRTCGGVGIEAGEAIRAGDAEGMMAGRVGAVVALVVVGCVELATGSAFAREVV